MSELKTTTYGQDGHLEYSRPRRNVSSLPQRGLSAYMFFNREIHQEVKHENLGLGFREVGRIIGERWKALSETQQAHYYQLATTDRKRYEMERATYKLMYDNDEDDDEQIKSPEFAPRFHGSPCRANINNVNSDVLISIINSILPRDLVNFVCTCRRVYEHASSRLILHRDLLHRYGTISLNGNCGDVVTPILDLLHSIQVDPLTAQYVFTVKFLPDDIEERQHVPGLLDKIEASKLELLLGQCLWLRPEDRADWMAAVRSADRGAAFVILLSFLPSLRRLHLTALEQYRPRLAQLLANPSGALGTTLGSVRTLHIGPWDMEDGPRLEDIGDLVYLPGLRALLGVGVNAHDVGENDQVLRQESIDRTSPIRIVRLLHSAIGPERLFEFLRPMKHLERLLYVHEGPTVGALSELDVDQYADDFEAVAQGWLEDHTLGLEVEGTNTIVLSKEAFGRWKQWRSRSQRQ